MARVLLHSLVFSPDGVSTAYLMTDLARGLARLGHRVTVLTTTPHYNIEPGAVARQPMVPVWRAGLLLRSSCDGITVYHVRMPMKGQQIAGRMLDYLRFHGVSLAAAVASIGPQDIVIAPSPPLTIGVVAWILGLRFRAPSIYNVQEVYPDFAVNQGLIRSPRVIRLLSWMERFVYTRSAAVVPISEWFARTIATRGIQRDKISVIPNFVDTELYRPLPRHNAFSREHGLDDSFVVLYGGNIGLSQDWASMLAAATSLVSLPITFVVVGDGARRPWLQAEVANRGLVNVRLLDYQPRERMPEVNAASNVGTIPMKATTTSDTFPSKIYTMLACGRPAIVSAEEDSELAWLLAEARCGRVVRPDDPDAYTRAVRLAYDQRDALEEEGMRGHRYVARTYSKETVAAAYDALIKKLLGQGQYTR